MPPTATTGRRLLVFWTTTVALAALAAGAAAEEPATGRPGCEAMLRASGVQGGLLVVVGAEHADLALAAVRRGPYLAQVLDADPKVVGRARQAVEKEGGYGLVSVDQLRPQGRLPYTENLVNLLVIGPASGRDVPIREVFRVLCPGGVVLAAQDLATDADLRAAGFEPAKTLSIGRTWLASRKPWPPGTDQWSHPRRGPDGNAVSHDEQVGPPRRIRWVAGPPQEISNMVSSAGRNYYAGVYARDGFNGLRLWQRALTPSPARGGFSFALAAGSVRPIASGERLFVVTDGKVLALEGATGSEIRKYPEAASPRDLLCPEGTLVAVDERSIRAVDAETGKLRWKHAAAEPRCVVAGDGTIYWVQGRSRAGEDSTALAVDLAGGKVRWRQGNSPWLSGVRACVYHQGLLAFETSSFSDDKPGNRLHVVSAADGALLWSRDFVPGMAHMKQARAMFAGQLLWVLDDQKCLALEPRTGQVRKSFTAGSGHCFPPVATEKYLFAGELNMTDLVTGQVDAHRITKGACSRDAGFVLANGLIYASPKHCVCWPMLRDYVALAPAGPEADPLPARLEARDFVAERGGADPASAASAEETEAAWPCYRHDPWRSASTPCRVPPELKIAWKVDLGGWPEGPIADDWRTDAFVRGPVTPPVCAGGMVYVARPDRHQVVALDAETGSRRWTFTANGRIDTPPTIHAGLCLFGTRSGSVYCLRADDGGLVWRLRAAPGDQRIVAYGQVESPWPVAGSVLVVEDVAFFAAGRQPLADGGILVFAVEPPSGKVRWVERLNTVPQTQFYAASGLEFESYDLLHREGPAVAMSRWLFDRRTGGMSCEEKKGFAHLSTGGGGVMAPRGCWSYGPRYESEQSKERPFFDPLAAFRGETLLGCSQDRKSVYRRDFRLAGGEKFNPEWFHKWTIQSEARKGGDLWRSQRLARGAKWSSAASDWLEGKSPVAAMVLTPEALFVAGAQGGLAVISLEDGKLLARTDLPAPVWDGLAVAAGRLLVTTQAGQVMCLAGTGK